MEELILIGGGGHCKSVIDSLRKDDRFRIIGILDKKEKVGTSINGVPIVGEDETLPYYFQNGVRHAFITLGSIGNIKGREKLYHMVKSIGFQLPVIIDPSAIISESAKIGEGTYVGKGAILNIDVKVGKNCIINTGAIIDHDCQIGDFCHIAPGTTLSGNVTIGYGSHIGTNSTVIQGIEIGSGTLIGAGSVVIKNIGSNQKAYGNPCRVV